MSGATATDPAILIVGAGPVGLTMAVELARRGVPFRIIDRDSGPTVYSKAVGIHPRSLEIFEQQGYVHEAIAKGVAVNFLRQFSSDGELMRVPYAGMESPYPFLLCLAQNETEAILIQQLTTHGVTVERNVELVGLEQTADCVTTTLKHADGNTETLKVAYVSGCDGSHSFVRKALQLAFEGEAYPQTFALADVVVHWELPVNEIVIFHHHQGVVAAFPLTQAGRYRLIFDVTEQHAKSTEPGEHGQPVAGFTIEKAQALVTERCVIKATLSDPVWLAQFHIHSRMVPQYQVGRVFVSGDAAHIHSPIGGQGMNTGMQDAFNLAWKLAYVVKGYAPASLLDSYHVERHPVAKQLLFATEKATAVLTLRNPAAQWVRNNFLRLVGKVHAIQKRILFAMSQLAVNYRKSPWVAEHPKTTWMQRTTGDAFATGPRAGERAPDGILLHADGTTSRVFEHLRDGKYQLLMFASVAAATECIDHLNANLGPAEKWSQWLTVAHIADAVPGTITPSPGIETLYDLERQLHHRYGLATSGLYLIRPDGYIGFRSSSIEAVELVKYLNKPNPAV